ncbi:MAG: Cell envelope-like protein function transcriptional attenuator common domain protein [Candidatus Daviesbacteria bacterium GW2011_GWA2_38_24]|uniref:Cell envelope-like protein function transcriptional attenuator common domain protein n=1 Tax=Candidatus Daviesbacteria bacterium GW2011_GWA2_38_24 TaxID=1618422 RepID=A0A0G0LSV4_9BACT|nr:MAG: Cell envelope-like protein function transcriptional attenuator common domain protein [Candidatus Daviesbacteria bacterium GW2011_GWA2_38_24]
MIYLYLDRNTIKFLYLKKTILNQQETLYQQKTYGSDLIDKGKVTNIDLLASAVKEVVSSSNKSVNENQVCLVLPQEFFSFFRTTVPSDIAASALNSFISDKARSILPVDNTDLASDFFVQESEQEKIVTYFGINQETLLSLKQAMTLIDFKINSIIPDKKILIKYLETDKIADVLKAKIDEIATDKKKINRVIISGEKSDNIRQDTFTKSVGVWTNPLKRIVPTFYEEYLKMLIPKDGKAFPILSYDVCFGAFILSEENKSFSLLKNGISLNKNKVSLPKIKMPKKETMLFISSFAVSFLLFILISKFKINLKLPDFMAKKNIVTITPTVVPSTPTPTPNFKKEEVKIKILNGSGVKGKATEIKEILKNKGYTEIITGNADNFDFKITEIQVKKDKKQLGEMIKNDLKDYVSAPKISILDDKEASDLVLIFAADFK